MVKKPALSHKRSLRGGVARLTSGAGTIPVSSPRHEGAAFSFSGGVM